MGVDVRSEDFGPVFSCRKCGIMVQWVNRHGRNVLEDMATGGQHHEIHQKGESLPRYVECTCGVACIDRHGQRYDLAGNPHKHEAAKPVTPPRPAPVAKTSKSDRAEGFDV